MGTCQAGPEPCRPPAQQHGQGVAEAGPHVPRRADGTHLHCLGLGDTDM